MTATTLMVQGTASDAGKSTLVAGLGRAWHRRGALVAPFKPQNMALNSAVAADGGEIARAQAVQALACGVEPTTDMSPVLIKPASDTDAQIIIHGRPVGDMSAVGYQAYKATAMKAVLESHRRLCQRFDRVLVEGAGSPAEINLRDNDIANMGFAEAADCPVLLVADIDKGGVFAQIVGTLELVSPSERDRIIGFVINRFRGDIALLQPGLDWLEARTGKPVFGVLPYLQGLHLEAEDAISSEQRLSSDAPLNVQVPVLPRISNHTDVDALRLHPGVNLQWVGPGREPGPADLIILPGSKNVRADLTWLRDQGWETHIRRHLRYGGKLLGICGGYQMLGRQVADPHGVEGQPGSTAGLGLLALATELGETKHRQNVTGELATGGAVCGYRIHCGRTEGDALANPFLQLRDGPDGAVSADNQIAGTYLHGLFDTADGCNALLAWAGLPDAAADSQHDIREAELNRLADAIETAIDLDRLP